MPASVKSAEMDSVPPAGTCLPGMGARTGGRFSTVTSIALAGRIGYQQADRERTVLDKSP